MSTEAFRAALIFPGQGSQAVGMGRELAQAYPAARQVFDEADRLLGFSLSQMAWEGPESELNDTVNTQPALLVHSAAVLRVLQETHPELQPAFTAGHSMGQISALIAAGVLPFAEALKLARRRGEVMKLAGERLARWYGGRAGRRYSSSGARVRGGQRPRGGRAGRQR